MKVILFWNPRHTPTDTITAVSWDSPDKWINPVCFTPEQDELDWLKAYGNPIFDPLLGKKGNVRALARKLGEWPKPYESDRFDWLENIIFNDAINF